MEEYKPGSVANVLSVGSKLKGSSPTNKGLFKLFSKKQQSDVTENSSNTEKLKKMHKKKKHENHEDNAYMSADKKGNCLSEKKIKKKKRKLEESVETFDTESDVKEKKPKKRKLNIENTHASISKRAKMTSKTICTVFIGNLPVNVDKKTLLSIFKECGEVESIRLRGAAPADSSLPKKAVVCKKVFHENVHSINAYIRFKQEKSVQEALKFNGHEIDSRHIRVDVATAFKEHDHQKSIFVGNLPFDADEEALREHFFDCGEMENIRIVRDSKTRIGKGFGFIQFKDKDSVFFALKLDGQSFQKRKLRLKKCSALPPRETNDQKEAISVKIKSPKIKFKKESAEGPKSFQGIMAEKAHNIKLRKKLRQKRKIKKQQGLLKTVKIPATQQTSNKIKGRDNESGKRKVNTTVKKDKHIHFDG